MLTLSLPNDWQTFFVERETNPATNMKIDGLANLFPEANSVEDCVKTLLDEDGTVFMTVNPITKKVELFHHFNTSSEGPESSLMPSTPPSLDLTQPHIPS